MPTELDTFHQEFFQEILTTADADGQYVEDAFFQLFCSYLVEVGELVTADRAPFLPPRGIRVDGYGGDPAENEDVLSLIIADFHQSPEVTSLTATEMDSIFKRLQQFVIKSLDRNFRQSLEETSPGFGLADLIASRWSTITKVRLILITNRLLSARVDSRPEGALEHASVTYSVWDIGRLHRLMSSGLVSEPIDIDLAEYGGPLRGLTAHLDGADYAAYLVVVPGAQLAAIYDRWGARLLESNVRSFLQARGNVNKGIRNTIENTPEMFFAYNNGITATAESVESTSSGDGILLNRLRHLQIVNGGQTTASIHAASRKKGGDLSKVFVQMKLSIIPPARSDEVVPKISEYANSQNRVNAADFFANHPFHVRMEGFSRRIYAPSPDGTFRESKWFYERARGQYLVARANAPNRAKFDLEYPKRQLFSKTDLAKYLNVWRGLPHVVSQGAQKNFANFAESIGKEWEKQPDSYNEMFYREVIAKAIVFRQVEALVSEQPWYQGGYRAQVVAYTIAKLAYDLESMGESVDFELIWRSQQISAALREALTTTATTVNEIIVETPAGIRNVTEWTKKLGCWQKVMDAQVQLPRALRDELLGREEKQQRRKTAVKEQKLLTGVEAQMKVVELGGQFWDGVRRWGLDHRLISPMEAEILQVASAVPDRIPSDRQSVRALEILNRLRAEGYPVNSEAN